MTATFAILKRNIHYNKDWDIYQHLFLWGNDINLKRNIHYNKDWDLFIS